MGDYYYLDLRCAHCNKLNEEVYYAESSNAIDFTCRFCKKLNGIIQIFKAQQKVK